MKRSLQQKYDNYRKKARTEIRDLKEVLEIYRSGEKIVELNFIIKEQAKIIIENYEEIRELKMSLTRAELSRHLQADNS